MGLIKKAFGAIFGLIGSIFKGALGIFGIGKKSGYFLELDESQDSEPAPKPAAEQPKPEPAKASESPKAAPAQATKEQAQKPEPAANNNASAPKPATQPSGSPLANPSGMAVASAKVDMKSAGNFSTEYLVNPKLSNGSRRRPGPSLSPFKDMAKQMQPSGR